ncbi:hypothetical protein [Leptospira meyeri]|uniref:hypothetical protein n=1 Tax=Leptospira meyeri TaxID=29508 RepID=UPI001082CF7E|nr:hypothetical protein [Leptospira meyeri]TGM22006.1 hypothetical protein EHQ73_09430 [Leptospira meyeri]
MTQATLTQKTEDQLDREVATKTYTVVSADIKTSLKLKARVLQSYEISVDTGNKTNTNLWNIVESMNETINVFQNWELPTSKELEAEMNSHLSNLAMRYEATVLTEKENKVKDRYMRLPSIEKIVITTIKQKDFKISGHPRPIFELQFVSNHPETLIPISYILVITRACLDEVLQSNEPNSFFRLRYLCEEFFSEADLHLSNFNKEIEKEKKKIEESTKLNNSQQTFSIVPNDDDPDGGFEDED